MIRKLVKSFSKFIDVPTAIAGAVIMGVIVWIINRKFGIWPASTAAMKQAAYTFFFGGAMTRLLYVIESKLPGKWNSIILSSIIVTITTVLMVYAVHSMRGTPRPLESTIPTALLAPFGFGFLAYRRRKSLVDGR